MRTPTATAVAAARRRVHAACLQLVADKLVVGSAGNISERLGDDWMIVSPGGRLYQSLTPADYPLVHLESKTINSGLQPTSEIELHLAVFQAFPAVNAVVHTHSKYAAAFAVARVDLPFVCNENIGPRSESILVTAPYAAPGTADLGAEAVRTFHLQPHSRAVLLANHGVVAVGESVEQAYTVAEQVEWIAEVTHHASLINPALPGVVTIPVDQQELIGRNYGFKVSRPLPPSRGDV